jgi:hypothetical protein
MAQPIQIYMAIADGYISLLLIGLRASRHTAQVFGW